MANVFISFLGTSNYKVCRYYHDNKPENFCQTNFVQRALVEWFCKNWGEEDKIFIFVTELAQKTNQELLSAALDELKLPNKILEFVEIPDGKNEHELWQIFNKVNEKLREGDHIYFDVTHAFRFIPMLACYLLNFAKIQKKVEVKKICYGAYAAVESEDNPLTEVLDLSLFDSLFDWALGVDKFKTSGDAAVVANLAEKKTLQDIHLLQFNHISKNSEKEFEIEAIRNIKKIVFSLKNYTDAVAVCHVKTALSEIDCIKENWKKIKDLELDVWLEENPEYQILFDTIKSLEEDFKDFSGDNDYNRIPLIEWCFKHQLVQQAVTIARETVLIYLVRLINKKDPRIFEGSAV